MKKEPAVYITRPAYIPLPTRGTRCPQTNLSHDQMLKLVVGPRAPVLCYEERSLGSKKVTKRMVKLDSLIAYMDSVAEEQKEASEATVDSAVGLGGEGIV